MSNKKHKWIRLTENSWYDFNSSSKLEIVKIENKYVVYSPYTTAKYFNSYKEALNFVYKLKRTEKTKQQDKQDKKQRSVLK